MITFSIFSSELNKKLSAISKVIEAKSSDMNLSKVVFLLKDGVLTIVGSSTDNTISAKVEGITSDGDVSFMIDKNTIVNAFKELTEQEVIFKVDLDAHMVTLQYINGHFRLPAESTETYPFFKGIDKANHYDSFELESCTLSRLIAQSLFATANDELRVMMNGIYFDLKTDSLNVVASDGHQLVRTSLTEITREDAASFILPKKPSAILKDNLKNSEEKVTVAFNNSFAEVTFGEFILCCRLIEGRYPNYNAVIPSIASMGCATVNRQSLISCIKRVQNFSNTDSMLVKMEFSESNITLSTEDTAISVSAKEQIPCSYVGEDMKIGFRSTSLMNILSALKCEEVSFYVNDPGRAGLIEPVSEEEGIHITMMAMPMILND